MNYDIIVENISIFPGPGREIIPAPSFVAVKDGTIRSLGPMSASPSRERAAQIVEMPPGRLLMPGLVNCHGHSAMSLFRGMADDLPLMEWLNEHIFPAEGQFVDEEMVYWCTLLACGEMLKSGTTTVADGYFHEEAAARAFTTSGIRSVAAHGIIDFPAPGVPDPQHNVKTAADFVKKLKGTHPLLTPALFCHSPYTCGPDTLKGAKENARALGVKLFIHLSETKAEGMIVQGSHGLSPTAFLNDLGILDQDTVCVHCIHLDDNDLDLLAASGAPVVTCPESNMKLASGTAPLPEMLRRGITVGIGTDGCASNNDLDLFGEMASATLLHKIMNQDPTALPAATVLELATTGGNAVLGGHPQGGLIIEGAPADMITIDLDQAHLTPFYNPDLLVYGTKGSDVREVFVNGRALIEDGEIISFDLHEAKERVRKLAEKVRRFRN